MTNYKLSNSAALAFEFAHQLLAGTLNLRRDLNSPDTSWVEKSDEDELFERLTRYLAGFRLSQLQIDDSGEDPDGSGSLSERRQVTLIVYDRLRRTEVPIATFYVHRDYLDGDQAEGWTRWQVKDVSVFVSTREVKLQKRPTDQDAAPIWGVDKDA